MSIENTGRKCGSRLEDKPLHNLRPRNQRCLTCKTYMDAYVDYGDDTWTWLSNSGSLQHKINHTMKTCLRLIAYGAHQKQIIILYSRPR